MKKKYKRKKEWKNKKKIKCCMKCFNIVAYDVRL